MKKEDKASSRDQDHDMDIDAEEEEEGEEFWTASKWFEDVLSGEEGKWCWEAWEGICAMSTWQEMLRCR